MVNELQISKRLSTEVQLLTTDPDVQSYFRYDNSGYNQDSHNFCIYGYVLPQTEPYKYGSFKVVITFPAEFPFKPPKLQLLTYIYHPAFENNTDTSKQRFCECGFLVWLPFTHVTVWLKQFVNFIDGLDNTDIKYCSLNLEAKALRGHSIAMFEKKALAMIMKYSYPRPNQSMISLKFAAKQMIREKLDFKPEKLNQLLLSISLKWYLNSTLVNK